MVTPQQAEAFRQEALYKERIRQRRRRWEVKYERGQIEELSERTVYDLRGTSCYLGEGIANLLELRNILGFVMLSEITRVPLR